jgi:hypothetical protein
MTVEVSGSCAGGVAHWLTSVSRIHGLRGSEVLQECPGGREIPVRKVETWQLHVTNASSDSSVLISILHC